MSADTLLERLKLTLINDLTAKCDGKPYLFTHGKNYTRSQLAKELTLETEVGLETLKKMILLALDMTSRGK